MEGSPCWVGLDGSGPSVRRSGREAVQVGESPPRLHKISREPKCVCVSFIVSGKAKHPNLQHKCLEKLAVKPTSAIRPESFPVAVPSLAGSNP